MINFREILPYMDINFDGVTNDSRLVKPNFLFLAYPGSACDGRDFIKDAIKNGACAIVYEPKGFTLHETKIKAFPLEDLGEKISIFANIAYPIKDSDLEIIGITGTNGKTSIAYMIAHAHEIIDNNSRYIGTLGHGRIDQFVPMLNTTPDALYLSKILHQYQQEKVKTVAMEVSSHALSLGRVQNVPFSQAIFTNLSRDHLDYHKTMQAYANAKSLLFQFPTLKTTIVNLDDEYADLIINKVPNNVDQYTYGFAKNANFKIIDTKLFSSHSEIKLSTPFGIFDFETNFIGMFNVYNIVAVILSLIASGKNINDIIQVVGDLKPPQGRLDIIHRSPAIIIDYAHTPDALKNVICALNNIKQNKLIVVFGCGGDRDRGKRSQMGEIATKHADWVIITSDNPRHEDPHNIMQEIESGVCSYSYEMIENRSQAIKRAINLAGVQDIVLIAGKGHEAYQHIGDKKIPYSDYAEVKKFAGDFHDS